MNNMTSQPMLIVICGWPLSGKNTIAAGIAHHLAMHYIDIDRDIRRPIFGMPNPQPNRSPDLMRRDHDEMLGSYKILWCSADIHLSLGRDLCVSCTLSREAYQ